jgi:hypothetical protein
MNLEGFAKKHLSKGTEKNHEKPQSGVSVLAKI